MQFAPVAPSPSSRRVITPFRLAPSIIYNNTAGTINMDLTDYQYTQPCVTRRMAPLMKANAVLYQRGRQLKVEDGRSAQIRPKEYNTMSALLGRSRLSGAEA